MDLVSRLHEARMTAQLPLACASSGSSIHHAVGLWPVHLQQDLRDALKIKGLRSVREWANLHGAAQVSWTHKHVDPFFNINTPGDLAAAEALFKLHLVVL
jgi:molybdopterin-guanine dinucleotide biosynthesis protein A